MEPTSGWTPIERRTRGKRRSRGLISCKSPPLISTSASKSASVAVAIAVSLLICIGLSISQPVVRCDHTSGQDAPLHHAPDISNKLGPLWLYDTPTSNDHNGSQEAVDDAANRMSDKLTELLTQRVGPNIRASSDYHDFQDVRLNETLEAWALLRKQVGAFARDQVHLYGPQLKRIAISANVSQQCLSSLEQFLASIERLESWAVQVWSSSGNFPPVGLFDGHFTDLGSYRGCVDIQRPLAAASTVVNSSLPSSPANASTAGQELSYAASYCLVGFRPVVPSRRRFHQIYNEEDPSLAKLFEPRDTFNSIAHWAQYFHYLYMKTGICVPVECSPSDIQQAARLIGRKLALITAPVKCFTRAELIAQRQHDASQPSGTLAARGQVDNKPVLVSMSMKLTTHQLVSLILVGAFFSLVGAATLWHCCEIAYKFTLSSWLSGCRAGSAPSRDDIRDFEKGNHECSINGHIKSSSSSSNSNAKSGGPQSSKSPFNQQTLTYDMQQEGQRCWQPKYVAFHYFSMITNGREFMDTSVRPNEIKCLHGFRVFTMIWIICVHTLQYNDWSGFSRAFENVASLQNPLVHPLINANYVVDNFFLMSGLLAAYTIWYNNKGGSTNFSCFQCLVGRYLRLTPQVLLISLLYIMLPLTGDGPFWYDVTHQAAMECEQNWWINLLHIQSFYKAEQMCNLVGWWISVDMFYYVLALGLVWMILNKHTRRALICTILFVAYCTLMTAWRHYSGGFEPNNLGTVPQIGEVWSEFVIKFFWSPYPHAFVFFLGLWLGYVLANEKWYHQVRRWSRLGWFVAIVSLLGVNYSSRLWTTGALELNTDYQALLTAYNLVCVIIWACAFGWIIVACHYGCAPALNKLCSTKMNIMISKASFIIYLSHMLLLRAYFGSQYNLIEVSMTTILLMLISLNAISIFFGVFLCIAFEGPCLKFQRLVLRQIKRERHLPIAGASYSTGLAKDMATIEEKNSLNLGPTSVTLLK